MLQREVVFRTDKQGIIDLALEGARLCKKFEQTIPETTVYYEYSPESYTGTELEFAADICNQVMTVLVPTPEQYVDASFSYVLLGGRTREFRDDPAVRSDRFRHRRPRPEWARW